MACPRWRREDPRGPLGHPARRSRCSGTLLAAISVLVFAYGVAPADRQVPARQPRAAAAAPSCRDASRRRRRRLLATSRSIRRATRTPAGRTAASSTASSSLFIGTSSSPSTPTSPSRFFGWRFFTGDFYLGYSLVARRPRASRLLVGAARDDGAPRGHAAAASWTTRGPTGRPATRSTTAGATASATGCSSARCCTCVLTGYMLEGVRIAMDEPGHDGVPAGRLAGRAARSWASDDGDARAPCGTSSGGPTAWSRSRSSPRSRTRRRRTCSRASRASCCATRRPASGCGRSRRARGGARRATARSPTSPRSTCSSSTRARSAASATRRAPRTRRAGRCRRATWSSSCASRRTPRCGQVGVGGVLGGLLRRPGGARSVGPRRWSATTACARRRVWSCMQCNACVETCPVGIEQAPIINQLRRRAGRGGRADPATCSRRCRRSTKSGNSFGENRRRRGRWTRRARVRGQGRAQGAGRRALVRRRLRVVRPALPGGHARDRAAAAPRPASTSGSSTTASATPATTSAASARRGCSRRSPSTTSAALQACEFNRIVTSDPHSLNTLRNEYPRARRRPGRSSTTPTFLLELLEARPARAAAAGCDTGSPTTTRATSAATTASYDAPRRDPRAARLRAGRDAAQPRQLVLLRRRRRPDLDDATSPGTSARRRTGSARRSGSASSTTSSSPAPRT